MEWNGMGWDGMGWNSMGWGWGWDGEERCRYGGGEAKEWERAHIKHVDAAQPALRLEHVQVELPWQNLRQSASPRKHDVEAEDAGVHEEGALPVVRNNTRCNPGRDQHVLVVEAARDPLEDDVVDELEVLHATYLLARPQVELAHANAANIAAAAMAL
jgi:hypothetical protein